jgi:hypothetical protein
MDFLLCLSLLVKDTSVTFPLVTHPLQSSSNGLGVASQVCAPDTTDLILFNILVTEGHAIANLVAALCYKPEGCWLESRWSGFFQLT